TEHDAKLAKVDSAESAANSAAAAADRVAKDLQTLAKQTQAGFEQVGPAIGDLRASVTKLEDSVKTKPAAAGAGKGDKKGGGEPAVAGPGEYTVKPGDSGVKIATANGVSIGDLQAVNPGVNWNKLKPGDKLKLPKK